MTFMCVAELTAELGTCSRLRVGAAIVKDGRTVTVGWNGVAAGLPHCNHDCTCPVWWDDSEHSDDCASMQPCTQAIHAEVRAIGSAAYFERSTLGATMYVTHSPCLSCAQLVFVAGIDTVVYREAYRKLDGLEYLSAHGVEVRRV